MNDKEKFQQTAQKLIDYDAKLRDKYQEGEFEVKYCPRGFCGHRMLLAIIVIVNTSYILLAHVIPVDMNLIFGITFLFMYRSYRKKVKKRDAVLYYREELLNSEERKGYIEILKKLADRHPEWKIEPWWDATSGMEIGFGGEYQKYEMNYFEVPLISEDERGRKYISAWEDYTDETKTGGEIKQLIKSLDYKQLTVSETNYENLKEYEIAGLFLWHSEEVEAERTQQVYSDDEIESMMDEYSALLDERERRKNYRKRMNWRDYETNEEKHSRRELEGGYNVNEDIDDWFERNRKEEKYRQKLERDVEIERYTEYYKHTFYQVGWIIFDKRRHISDILLNKKYAYKIVYAACSKRFGMDCIIRRQYKMSSDERQVEISGCEIISKLNYLKLKEMDYTSKRPNGVTLKEWATWIYIHSN